MKNIISLLIVFFIVNTCFAQNKTSVDLSNPNATIYTHLYFLQKDTYLPKNAAKTIYGLNQEDAIEKAIKIKKILDGKGLKVDFTKVPNNSNFSDSTSYNIGNHYTLFPVRMPEIVVKKYGDKWLYSRETIATVDDLYNKIFPWHTNWLKKITAKYGKTDFLGIKLWQFLGLAGLVFFGYLFFYIFKRILFFIFRKIQQLITNKTNNRITLTLKKLARPLVLLVIITFYKIVAPSLQLGLEVNSFLFLAFNIAQIVFWIYVLLKIVRLIMTIYAEHTKRTHMKLDDQLVPILTHFLTGIVVFIGALKLLTLFGIPFATVLAGASIGGLALALASQDTVKNLIGTFMIFLDKPFHIGDWIETSELKGTVEEVGFRSTRIRAADTSVYQIPNSTLSEIVINNLGLRLFRRYQTELGIRYDTPPILIEAFADGLKKLIEAHPNVKKDMVDVAFIDFGDSALKIMMNIYFNVNDWSSEQHAKHILHIGIVKLAKILGVEFAFPSSTLMIEEFPEKENNTINYIKEQKVIDDNIQEIIDDFIKNDSKLKGSNTLINDDD
jgi:MscS family membrane protein